jgi:uncharacterized membrane protein (DUF485 family)
METTSCSAIRSNLAFSTLVRRRRKVVTWLTVATLAPYYVFILIAAYKPTLLVMTFSVGSLVTAGWLAAVLLIVGTWLLTGLYIRYANGEFDALTREIGAGVAR